ncbi:MAG TPA: Flp family type IVb pilin [Streptosporangiaceae bacterium]
MQIVTVACGRLARGLAAPASVPGRLDERGVTSVEYAILGALIAVVVSGAVALLGQGVLGLFSSMPAGL